MAISMKSLDTRVTTLENKGGSGITVKTLLSNFSVYSKPNGTFTLSETIKNFDMISVVTTNIDHPDPAFQTWLVNDIVSLGYQTSNEFPFITLDYRLSGKWDSTFTKYTWSSNIRAHTIKRISGIKFTNNL